MADTLTPVLGLTSIEVGGSNNTWGAKLDANFAAIDSLFHSTTGHQHLGSGTHGSRLLPGSLLGISTYGITVAKDATTFIARTLGALANGGIAITNGDGVAGAPSFSVNVLNATLKSAAVGADAILIADSAAGNALKYTTRDGLFSGSQLTGSPYAFTNLGATGGAVVLAADTGTTYKITANANVTFSITGAVAGKTYIVEVNATNLGAYTVTLPSGTKIPGGGTPTFSPAGRDRLFFISDDGGTTWDLLVQLAFA